jgi:hypothetical protein
MKNKVLFYFLLLFLSFRVYAQDSKFKLGIRFAPNISATRVIDTDEKDGFDFESDGAGVRFSAGLTGDFYFSKNTSFYTGIWYTVNRSSQKFKTNGLLGNLSGSSSYNIQYVQIPVALKLFTNEIATDMKLYFVLGGTLGLKINEKDKEWKVDQALTDSEIVSKPGTGNGYTYVDVGLLAGAGVEYQMGENTIAYGGLSYNRGLTSVQSKKGPFMLDDKDAKSAYRIGLSLISLEVGLKF